MATELSTRHEYAVEFLYPAGWRRWPLTFATLNLARAFGHDNPERLKYRVVDIQRKETALG